MEIEELHDLKAYYKFDFYKYQEEPLLEYVWQVAEKYCRSYDYDYSLAPGILANRYLNSLISIEDLYEKVKAIHPDMTFDDFVKNRKKDWTLDTSFKERYLSKECEELHDTIQAFGLDISKFWYLLLFVYDFVEDLCIDAPKPNNSEIERINEFNNMLSKATGIILKTDDSKIYESSDKDVIIIIKAAWEYFTNTYNDIMNNKDLTDEEVSLQIKHLGLKGSANEDESFSPDETRSLGKTYKAWKFAEIFQFFLEDKKAKIKRSQSYGVLVSKDKMLFISRLLYVVGYEGKDWYEEYDIDGNKNRKLSNVLRKYRNKEFPPSISNIYQF